MRASLDLTHVLYNDESHTSFVLALVTLSPILLMAAYASLVVQTREILIVNMWAGQMACEGLNWVLKSIIQEDRPDLTLGTGYGFPSSHSQWMGYFASYLILHVLYRHRFEPSGFGALVDTLWRLCVYAVLISWAGAVAYSRYSLGYHAPNQVLWGLGIGVIFGTGWYYVTEIFPRQSPGGYVDKVRRWEVDNVVSRWLGVRDGWAVWADGGREAEWQAWNRLYHRTE
jgi:dolichyldiphosphatase